MNNQIAQQNEGRLFAVVHLVGKQFKITTGDIIIVEGYWPPNIGDKIRLDKVNPFAHMLKEQSKPEFHLAGTLSWW